ncbi:MAG: NACHT and WD repeat domain-containing protein [Spirulina sp.]
MDFEDIAGLINQVALEQIGRPLRDVERLVLKGAWENQTYGAIAKQAVGYSEDYLKKDVGPNLWHLLSKLVDINHQGIKVTKRNLQNVLRTWAKQRKSSQPRDAEPPVNSASSRTVGATVTTSVQVAPAVEVAGFCGRAEELATLTQWITGEGMADGSCGLVLLWGLPGLGKTALAGQLLQRLGPTVERCGYLDMADCPGDEALLTALATWLSPGEVAQTVSVDGVMAKFSRQRCLLVVDHLEGCFVPHQRAGHYRLHTEALQQLIQRWATGQHPGCVVLMGREPPADRFQWMGPRARDYRLQDLDAADTQTLLQRQGVLPATPDQGEAFWQRYGGNPMFLRSVATTLQTVYQGQLSPLLAQTQHPIPDAVRRDLAALLQRLTPEEETLLYWVALAHAPMALADLQTAMPNRPEPAVVQSLVDRCLCQAQTPASAIPSAPTQPLIDLPPLVRALVKDQLLTQLTQELLAGEFHWLQRLPLVTMAAQEAVQEAQRAAYVVPLAQQLQRQFPHQADLVQACHQRLQTLRQRYRGQPGFGAANWLHLCQALGVSVSGVDFSDLALWQADLRQVSLQGANLSQVQFRETALATALGRSPRVAFCPLPSPRSKAAPKPDERLMVTGDQDGRLLLWEVNRGRLVQVMDDGEALAVQSLAVSPDGGTLAIGSDTGQIWLWPMGGKARSDTLSGHGAAVQTVAFSGDGAWLASGDRNGELRLWEVASGRCWVCWNTHQGAIHSIAFNEAGDRLVSGGDDQVTCLWDLSQGGQTQDSPITAFQAPVTATVRSAGFLPDPNDPTLPPMPFAAGYDEHCLTLWDVRTGRSCWMLPADVRTLPALTLSPDGRYLACSRQDFSVVVWDIPSRSLCYTLPPADSPVWLLDFSPDSDYLVTGGDYRLHLWQANTGTELRRFLSQAHPVSHLAVSAQGNQVLTGHRDARLRLWPQATGDRRSSQSPVPQVLSAASPSPHSPLQAVALSADGQWCARAAADSGLSLWHIPTGECRWSVSVPVHLIAFSPDGQSLATVGPEDTLHLWSVADGQRRHEGIRRPVPPMALTFGEGSDNPTLIVGARDGTIEIWPQSAAASVPQLLTGHQRLVHSLGVGADGQSLVSASHDGTVRWWNVAQGRTLGIWSPPDGHWVHSVAVDPSGVVLAITSQAADLAIWEVQTHRLRYTLRGHSQPPWTALVCPDRTHLATASQDHEIRLWNLALGHCERVFHPDRPYAGANIRDAKGLSPSEMAILKSLGAVVI